MGETDDQKLAQHLVLEMRDLNRALMSYHDRYGSRIGRLAGQDALASLRELIAQPMEQCGWCRDSFYQVCVSGLCAVCEQARGHIASSGEPDGDGTDGDQRHLRLVK